MPNFLYVEDTEGNPILCNLDQIIMVSEIRAGHCLITFAHNILFHVAGDVADTLVTSLMSEARLSDGTTVAEMAERQKQAGNSTPSKVIPFDGSEPQS
jgi:hypothetical protein